MSGRNISSEASVRNLLDSMAEASPESIQRLIENIENELAKIDGLVEMTGN